MGRGKGEGEGSGVDSFNDLNSLLIAIKGLSWPFSHQMSTTQP